jgi:hypothetical protein
MQKNQGSRLFDSGKSTKSKAHAEAKLVDSAEPSSANTENKTEENVNLGRPTNVDPTHRFGKRAGSK